MNTVLPPAGTPATDPRQLLRGQKALVTGANSGIGRATAVALGQAGADVVVNYVTGEESAEAAVEEIRRARVRVYAHCADVSNEEQVKEMFGRMVAELGTIDILVNNAGRQKDAGFIDMSLADWNAVISVNLTGQFLCAREAIREFLRRGVVASVSCGAIRTPINTAAWSTPEAYHSLMTLVPYGRIGEPEDIARTAVWLASDESDYLVGATIFVDGGMTLYPGFTENG
jgi:glucose 1-dehydrogenase